MAEETIVFAQGIELPPDILEQGRQLKPPGFRLQMLPPDASAAAIAAAIRDAEYLTAFLGSCRTKRIWKLAAQAASGAKRWLRFVNIAGARKARIPICSNGR